MSRPKKTPLKKKTAGQIEALRRKAGRITASKTDIVSRNVERRYLQRTY